MRRLLRWPYLVGLALVLVVAVVLVRGCGEEAGAAPPYETAEVQRGDLVSTVSATGTLSAVGTVEVGTQVSGTVDRVLVDFNDRVERGELLAVLDPEALDAAVQDARAGVERARAALQQAEAQLEEAEGTLERNRALADRDFLSEQEFAPMRTAVVAARAQVASSRAQVASAEAALARALKDRRNAEIRAPMGGVVIQRSIEPGQTVAASFSTPTLFVIAEDLREMEILAQVDESDIGLVEPGQAVTFTVPAYPERTFEGVVVQERLQPETVQNVVLYTVVVSARNEDGRLLPGMTATLDFVVGGVEDALVVPTAALRFEPPGEIRTAAREAQRAAADTSEATHDAPAFAADVAELWIPREQAGEGPPIRPVLVRVLATDGTRTAIAPTAGSADVVAAGLGVVTRMDGSGGAFD